MPTPPNVAEYLQAANAAYHPGFVAPGITPLLNADGKPVVQSILGDGFDDI